MRVCRLGSRSLFTRTGGQSAADSNSTPGERPAQMTASASFPQLPVALLPRPLASHTGVES
jgi:hypothetical protein